MGKNPQPVAVKQQDGVIRKGEKTISFKNRLFQITYEPKNGKDILKTGGNTNLKLREKFKNIWIEMYSFSWCIKLN